MNKIIKPLSTSVDINSSASTVSDSVLVSVLNTTNAVEEIIVSGSGYNVKIGAGERLIIEKATTDQLDATGATGAIWAIAVAYRD